MAVSRVLSGRVAEAGCRRQCKTCATVGRCVCPQCPARVARVNQTWFVLDLYQSRRAPQANRA
eukprot:199585-Lingulodinium_polyedra.AAC.1